VFGVHSGVVVARGNHLFTGARHGDDGEVHHMLRRKRTHDEVKRPTEVNNNDNGGCTVDRLLDGV
jgi:hypothetical protein